MASHAPFRADEVGSLLRPQAIKDARASFADGKIDAAQLKAIEDSSIRDVVARQEAAGLQAVTDGEYRRSWWHFDFLAGLGGCELIESDTGIQFDGVETKSESIGVTGKVEFCDHYMLDHFRFLKDVLKCLVGVKNEKNIFVNYYQKFLEWDIMKRPILTVLLEKIFDPLIGKSLVLYFKKNNDN